MVWTARPDRARLPHRSRTCWSDCRGSLPSRGRANAGAGGRRRHRRGDRRPRVNPLTMAGRTRPTQPRHASATLCPRGRAGPAVDPGGCRAGRGCGQRPSGARHRRGPSTPCRSPSTNEIRDRRPRRTLVSEARDNVGPQELRRIGRGLLEVVATGIAQSEDWSSIPRLVAEESGPRRAETRLNIRDRGRRDPATSPPRSPPPDAHRASRPTSRRPHQSPRRHPLGDATSFRCHERRGGGLVCAPFAPGRTSPRLRPPRSTSGTATSVMIIIDLDTLKARPTARRPPPGTGSPAEQARRLACPGKDHPRRPPAGKGEILDQGRAPTPLTPGPTKAMELRDRHCTAHGCDMPRPPTAKPTTSRNPRSPRWQDQPRPTAVLCPFPTSAPPAHDPAWITNPPPPTASTSFHRRDVTISDSPARETDRRYECHCLRDTYSPRPHRAVASRSRAGW